MDQAQVFERLTGVFRQVFSDPALTIGETTSSADIDAWDSLNHLVLVSAVETEFKIKFKLKELLNMENVGDMARLIAAKAA